MKINDVLIENIFGDNVRYSDAKIAEIPNISYEKLITLDVDQLQKLDDDVQQLMDYMHDKKDELGEMLFKIMKQKYPNDVLPVSVGDDEHELMFFVQSQTPKQYYIRVDSEAIKDPDVRQLMGRVKTYRLSLHRTTAVWNKIIDAKSAVEKSNETI